MPSLIYSKYIGDLLRESAASSYKGDGVNKAKKLGHGSHSNGHQITSYAPQQNNIFSYPPSFTTLCFYYSTDFLEQRQSIGAEYDY